MVEVVQAKFGSGVKDLFAYCSSWQDVVPITGLFESPLVFAFVFFFWSSPLFSVFFFSHLCHWDVVIRASRTRI